MIKIIFVKSKIPSSKTFITSAVPVEHETLKSGRDGKGRDGTRRDDAGRTDVKVEIFIKT